MYVVKGWFIHLFNNVMMYGYESVGMMGGFGFLAVLLWIVLFADLLLVGIWLWKKISKE